MLCKLDASDRTSEVVDVVFAEEIVQQRQSLPHSITDALRRQVEDQRQHLLEELYRHRAAGDISTTRISK